MRKLLLGACVIGALVGAASVVPMAQAESGRRICVYRDETAGDSHVWNVVDYKKDGSPECPRLYSPDMQGMGGDWKKITCEAFASPLGKTSDSTFDLKPDPCSTLVNDHVYEITQDQSTHTYSSVDKGAYKQFQRSIRFHAYPGVGAVYYFCAATLDARGNKLDSDCDKVGVNGTSRLFYRPGTTRVVYSLATVLGRAITSNTVDVTNGAHDAKNYCVDRRVKVFTKGEYTASDYC